jgi:putative thiamine transport system substrate-binding protein
MRISRRRLTTLALTGVAVPLFRHGAWAGDWAAITAEARGQTVYFNAWAGAEPINAYIAWAGEQLEAQHGVKLVHVKISDAAEVVRRVRDEVKAGSTKGSVDLIWINGENFRRMKADGLLFGPFATTLPNFTLVDTRGKPTTLSDFAEPTQGLESPWGMAQLTFFGAEEALAAPPQSMAELVRFAAAHPGRVSYPAPPDFHGTTFVKQALIETVQDRSLLSRPADTTTFESAARSLFALLDGLHPSLWRGGKQFPPSQAQQKQMLADGELIFALTFNPNEPANLIAAQQLPASTVAWQFRVGTIGNTHFVAIPLNAPAKAGAQVVANFLLSPEAQARKADLKIWGDPTVLDVARLPPEAARLFVPGRIPGLVAEPAPAIPEPHGSWVPLLEAAWLSRYAS